VSEQAEYSKRDKSEIDEQGGIALEYFGNAAYCDPAFTLAYDYYGQNKAECTAETESQLLNKGETAGLHNEHTTQQRSVKAGKGETGCNDVVGVRGNKVEEKGNNGVDEGDGNHHDKGASEIGVFKNQVGERCQRCAQQGCHRHHHGEKYGHAENASGVGAFDKKLSASESACENYVFNRGSPKHN